jgi:hypothetical protein
MAPCLEREFVQNGRSSGSTGIGIPLSTVSTRGATAAAQRPTRCSKQLKHHFTHLELQMKMMILLSLKVSFNHATKFTKGLTQPSFVR